MKKLVRVTAIASLSLAAAALADVVQAPKNQGLYIGGNIGVVDPSTPYADVGVDAGLQLGYRFNKNFRAELASSIMSSQSVYTSDVDLNTVLLMTNGYFDIDMGSPVVPFVGAGIGYINEEIANSYTDLTATESGLAYQGIVGLSFKLNCDLRLEFAYHYVASTNDILFAQNLFNIGLNYYFS